MKRLIVMLIGGLLWMQPLMAQNTVESIRQRYAELKEMTTRMGQGMPPEYYHVTVMQNLPGTGMHEENVRMYYGDNNDDEIYPTHHLTLATSSYNFAARKFYEEYLFDRDGKVSFVYGRMPMELDCEYVDFRFYLDADKVLKVVIKGKKEGNNGLTDLYDGSVVTDEYMSFYEHFLAKAKQFQKVFSAIDGATYK